MQFSLHIMPSYVYRFVLFFLTSVLMCFPVVGASLRSTVDAEGKRKARRRGSARRVAREPNIFLLGKARLHEQIPSPGESWSLRQGRREPRHAPSGEARPPGSAQIFMARTPAQLLATSPHCCYLPDRRKGKG
jgi:hypothetical protein